MVFVETPVSLRGEGRSLAPVQLVTSEGLRIGLKASSPQPAESEQDAAGETAAPTQGRRTFFVFVEPPLFSGTDGEGFDHLRLTCITVIALDTVLIVFLASAGLGTDVEPSAAQHVSAIVGIGLATNAVGAFAVARSSSVTLWLFATAIVLQVFLFFERVLSSSQVLHHGLQLLAFFLALTVRQWTAWTFFQIAPPQQLARAQGTGT